jgi:hypothetical protein
MRYVVLGGLVLVLLASFACTGACWYLFVRETPLLETSLALPEHVAAGQPFDLVVHAHNPHAEPVTLDSVDVDLELLGAFQVLEVVPPPAGTLKIPLLDQRSWTYGRAVPPGETWSVTFRLRPLQPGHFSGTIDVCNPSQQFTSHYADIVVQ